MRVEIPIVVVNPAGVPFAGASVQVNVRGTSTATIVYAGETGPTVLTNPLTSDAFGRVTGWVERGAYDVVISGGGLTTYTEYFDANPGRDGAIDTLWIADGAINANKLGALA